MPHEIATAVDKFLSLVKGEPSSVTDIGRLIESLDELAWQAHRIRFESDETEYVEPITSDPPVRWRKAESWLRGMQEGCSGDGEMLYAVAVDDLSELIADMEEVQWRFNNTSEADALFHYQLGFQTHWGQHLRSLQKSLHDWYW